MLSCTLIIPAALRDKANTLAEAMGWGDSNYTVPLSADGAETATHYGLHTWVHPSFDQMISEAGDGVMPEALVEAGYPTEDFTSVLGAVTVSIRDDVAGHFAEVVGGAGLVPQNLNVEAI